MALIICPIHGESGFTTRFSKNVVNSISENKVIREGDLVIFSIILVDDTDGEVLFTEEYLLFKSEFEDMGVSRKVEADTEKKYNFYYSLLPETSGLCFKCFSEYKASHDTNLLNFN